MDWSWANLVTTLRLLLIPFYLTFFLSEKPEFRLVGLGLFATAVLSDLLDGYLARRTGVTEFGIFMDPLVDRLLIGSVVVLVFVKGIIPLVALLVVVGRDLTLVLGQTYLHTTFGVSVPVTFGGKLSSAAMMVSMCLMIIGISILPAAIAPALGLFYFAVGMGVATAAWYVRAGFRAKAEALSRVTGDEA